MATTHNRRQNLSSDASKPEQTPQHAFDIWILLISFVDTHISFQAGTNSKCDISKSPQVLYKKAPNNILLLVSTLILCFKEIGDIF